ncbi:MAG: polysaccharide deacetylase [Candidatus Bathyarchaeia archaeon]
MPVVMPSGKKCAVCLTFDFDTFSLWLGTFGATSPAFMSRGEFGARVGAPRILSLLDKYGLKATWFVPGHTADTFPEAVKDVHRRGHEIGHHGYAHENPTKLTLEEERTMIERGLEALKRTVGERPYGFRSPAWDTSPNTISLLLEHDFIYGSNLMADDFRPYKLRIGDEVSMKEPYKFGKETKLLEIPPSWYLDDFPVFEFLWYPVWNTGNYPPSHVFESWKAIFDYMYEEVPGGVFVLTCHPQVSGRAHLVRNLERLIQHMHSHKDVWFARGIDIAKAWKD